MAFQLSRLIAERKRRRPSIDHQRGAVTPIESCHCDDCERARHDAHGAKVGALLGMTDPGGCPCGRARGEDGRCCAWWQCPYAQAEIAAAEAEKS